MRRYLLTALPLALFFFCSTHVSAQELSDTTVARTQQLSEVIITGYDNQRKLLNTPGAISIIEPEQVQAYDETSVVPVMNTLPGVRMEERSPGSYRIAIRGSSLRAPFGVRNIKVYWNNIPFTDPTGSTAFNLLDVINMNSIEVIKGPAGSVYGAGTGGVVNIRSLGDADTQSPSAVQLGATGGSFGLQRYTGTVNVQSENTTLSVKYAHQQAEGYRDHSAMRRDVLELSGQFEPSAARQISTSFLYANLDYEIPGGLTQEQFDENPRQARAGSKTSNASINQQYVLLGVSQHYDWNEQLSNLTTVYGDFSFFENPFIFNYKRDSRQSGGVRSRFHYDTEMGILPTRFTAGAEVQRSTNVARNFGNRDGQPGALNFDDELRAQQAIFFANALLELPYDVSLTVGASYNLLNYDIYRLINTELNSTYRSEKRFAPVLTPRVGLTKALTPQIAAHASVSYGFSPPTLDEIRTNEGSINLGLEAERGINYELGLRGTVLPTLDFDLTTFFFRLNETIVPRQSERGTTLFTNTGSTNQRGLEVGSTWFAVEDGRGWLRNLELRGAYTYHYFTFTDYAKGEEDFSGNRLTGVAPQIVVLSAQATTRYGLFANATYNHTGKIPLNDANTVYADGYHLVQAKVGYQNAAARRVRLRLFVGVDNALNQIYSLGNDLNAFGARYFQPSAPRNYYLGMKLGL